MKSDYKIDMYSELAFQSSQTLMFGYPSMNINEPLKKKISEYTHGIQFIINSVYSLPFLS